MKRNPRKLKWTKAFRKASGKEMTVVSFAISLVRPLLSTVLTELHLHSLLIITIAITILSHLVTLPPTLTLSSTLAPAPPPPLSASASLRFPLHHTFTTHQDSTLAFEKRRHVPIVYDRDLVQATIAGMKRIQEVKTRREKAFYKARYVRRLRLRYMCVRWWAGGRALVEPCEGRDRSKGPSTVTKLEVLCGSEYFGCRSAPIHALTPVLSTVGPSTLLGMSTATNRPSRRRAGAKARQSG